MINGTYPGGMAMSKRLHLYAKAMQERGLDPMIYSYARGNLMEEGVNDGNKFRTYPNPVWVNNYVMRQFYSFFVSFWFAIISYRESKHYKLIYFTGFGWFTALLMIICIHLGNSKCILEVNENPYSPEGGRLDPIWIRRIRRKLMLSLTYPLADGFIVISNPLIELVNKYKKEKAQVLYIPILTDNNKCHLIRTVDERCPFILHAGALSETKDGIIAVFEAFAIACNRTDTDLKFILTIKTIQLKLKRVLDRVIEENGLTEKVIFKDFIPEPELDELRYKSTLAIVNKPANWQNDYNFPTKLGELLSAGVPVIASITGEMCNYLKDNETAFLVPANDKEAIAEKILYILKNPGDAERVGKNGRRLAESRFYYSVHAERLYSFINALITYE